ncbi:(Fe-S)-binding protein [Pseudoclavibacter sp. 13-3]|uniref:(Fe-S)-binding protein n=1 Tax=Pseudoclavibacter sp. 13-3 TaxID=2901228 RepID=UPI001E44CD7D|nr:(Fe-S)-binding protein [Pseudoclavibacter sp. 13-3]MCD7100644.1 (Fe-S)-binding protein [Pseudoclavibacter sp. 13-3]
MRVGIFGTCLVDTLYPDVIRATARLITRLGHEAVFPEGQTCCGQMHINTGYQKDSLPLVQNYVDVFGDSSIDAVVLPSGSCTGSVRHQHPMIAGKFGDEALSREVSSVNDKTYDLAEFIVDVLGLTDVGAYFPHTVTYHPTCHSLRMIQVGSRPYRLLQNVEGLELRELPFAKECCGFGGTFAVKNAATSTAMVEDKVAHIEETGAEYCAAGDASCLTNIGGAMSRLQLGTKTIHLAQILASTHADADRSITLLGEEVAA